MERERGASEGFQRWAGFLPRRQTGGGSRPAYLQFQSAVLTAAATLGRGRGGLIGRNRRRRCRTHAATGCLVRCGWGGDLPVAPTDGWGWSLGQSGPRRAGPGPPVPSARPAAQGLTWRGWRAHPRGHMCFLADAGAEQGGGRLAAGAGGLVMNHVVPPAARSPGRGQGADSPGRWECFQSSLACRGGCWPGAAAPAFPDACGAHRKPWVFVPGQRWREGSRAAVGEHLPPPAQRAVQRGDVRGAAPSLV